MIETNRIEYKAKLTDSLEKEIVAFLNYNGGAIVHNDYINEVPPVFEIYDDRLEITSSGGLHVIKSKEEFFQGYSNPINRGIMRIYKDLDMVEHLGSGMNRILSFYKKDVFLFSDNFLRIVFKTDTSPIIIQENTQETIQETIKKRSTKYKIIEYLKEDGSFTRDELAELIGVSSNTIKQHLAQLKSTQKIKRIGSTKSGHWEVLDD